MPAGKIAECNVRTGIMMRKDLKYFLESKASKDNRSLNNLMVCIIEKWAIENGYEKGDD